MSRDFHNNPFDEGTNVKLGLFRDYVREWLPVWLSRSVPGVPITIADFFAGPGSDCKGNPGSPLITLEEVRKSALLIEQRRAQVRLLLNEAAKGKAATLRRTMNSQNVPSQLCEYEVTSLDFEKAFDKVCPNLRNGPTLLILDQQGMKALSPSSCPCYQGRLECRWSMDPRSLHRCSPSRALVSP